MTNSNKQQKRNRRTIVLMLLMSVLPIVAAILFYINPQWIGSYKNYGTLITPPLQLQKNDLTAFGDFSQQHFSELDDHWVFIHIMPEQVNSCHERCAKALYHSHQLWIMLNQNLMRLRRVAVFPSVDVATKLKSVIGDDYLLYAVGSQSLFNQLSTVLPTPIDAGTIVLRDPLGNIMLWYSADFDPYKAKKDLSRLFRTSRIG
ncbi:MAG: hypothetical protein V3U88_11140 [Methylococcales bacterium]